MKLLYCVRQCFPCKPRLYAPHSFHWHLSSHWACYALAVARDQYALCGLGLRYDHRRDINSPRRALPIAQTTTRSQIRLFRHRSLVLPRLWPIHVQPGFEVHFAGFLAIDHAFSSIKLSLHRQNAISFLEIIFTVALKLLHCFYFAGVGLPQLPQLMQSRMLYLPLLFCPSVEWRLARSCRLIFFIFLMLPAMHFYYFTCLKVAFIVYLPVETASVFKHFMQSWLPSKHLVS